MRFPYGTISDFSDACGHTFSNFEAEISALNSAIELTNQHLELQTHQPTNVVFFSDSNATLEALEKFSTNSNRDIQNIALVMTTSYDIPVTMQRVLGHADIRGNDHADCFAKQVASKE